MLYALRRGDKPGERKIEISFGDKRLARDCQTERDARRRFGKNGDRVRARIAELRAADVLSDLWNAPGKLHGLTGDRSGQYAMHLLEPYRIVFTSDDDPIPRDADGAIEASLVKSVRILEVTDYHGR